MPAPVQDAVDRAAAQLGLSLLIEDLRQHPVWWCTVGPVDPVRTRTVLDRTVGPDAADVVREFGLRQATVPVRTPAMPERGMWARWAVPVRHDGAPLGLLWVLDPDGVVTDRDLVELTELATLAAEELHVHRTTLYYRLDRIKELTGADLRDGATRTDLQLALRLHAYRSL